MSKTLEELGYEKREDTPSILRYWKQDEHDFCDYKISFYKNTKKVEKTRGNFDAVPFTMEELKAIYKYCIDNKWI